MFSFSQLQLGVGKCHQEVCICWKKRQSIGKAVSGIAQKAVTKEQGAYLENKLFINGVLFKKLIANGNTLNILTKMSMILSCFELRIPIRHF